MKKMFIAFSFLLLSAYSYAQNTAILNLPIPHYKILRADSTYITQAALDRHKPVMFIYFSPDCPHCQRLMNEIEKNWAPFKHIQIVMVCATRTVYPYLGLLKNFSRDFSLAKYKNITMGSEFPKTALVAYFNVKTTPCVVVFDRNGKMSKYLDVLPKIDDIIAAVKKVSS